MDVPFCPVPVYLCVAWRVAARENRGWLFGFYPNESVQTGEARGSQAVRDAFASNHRTTTMPATTSAIRQAAVNAFSVLATATVAVWAPDRSGAAEPTVAKPKVRKPRVLVTLSKETTRITEPLRNDGYVDYVAALDQQSHSGVPTENNSAVLFWRAVGPAGIEKSYREKYFQMLGIPPPPEKGDYFVNLEKYLAQQDESAKLAGSKPKPRTWLEVYAMLDPALTRSWSKEEFPLLAAWLAANEKPLDLLVEASKRPRQVGQLLVRPDRRCLSQAHPSRTKGIAAQARRGVAQLRTTVENTASLDKSMHGDPAAALSERVGQILLIMLAPPATLEADLADRATMTFELNKLTFALAAYRANHGSYPAKLADLSPKYVREVPHDIFNDAQPHYRQEGKGYLLYSVGSNGEDDGGKGFENGRRAGESVENDDLVVRMPAPTGPTKKAD